eukprot:gene15296-biopygen4954
MLFISSPPPHGATIPGGATGQLDTVDTIKSAGQRGNSTRDSSLRPIKPSLRLSDLQVSSGQRGNSTRESGCSGQRGNPTRESGCSGQRGNPSRSTRRTPAGQRGNPTRAVGGGACCYPRGAFLWDSLFQGNDAGILPTLHSACAAFLLLGDNMTPHPTPRPTPPYARALRPSSRNTASCSDGQPAFPLTP